jgi:hypothetical protein
MTGKRGFTSLLGFTLLFLSALSPLFAKGRADRAFSGADRLANEGSYVEAINEVVRIVAEDPSLLSNAERRLETIMRSAPRSSAIDLHPFDTILEQILINGRTLIDQENYVEAFNLYLSGLSFHQNVLVEPNYPENAVSPTTTSRRIINSLLTSFNLEVRGIREIAAGFNSIRTASNNPREQLMAVTRAVDRFRIELNRIIRTKASLWTMRDSYLSYNEVENNAEGRYYAAFGNLMISGRPEADVQEGLLGVAHGLWRQVTQPLKEIAINAAVGAFAEMYAALQNHDYALFRRLVADTTTAMRGALEILSLSISIEEQDNRPTRTVLGMSVQDADVSYFAVIESLNRVMSFLSQSAVYSERYDAATTDMLTSTTLADYRAGRITMAQAVQRERDLRIALSDLETAVRGLAGLIEESFYELFPIRISYDGAFRGGEFFRSGITFNSELGSNLSRLNIAAAMRQYTVENEDLAATYSERRLQFNAGSALSDGVLRTLADGERYLSKNPLEAARIFDSLMEVLPADIARGREILDRYDRENVYVVNAREIITLRAEAEDLLAQYEALYTQSVTLAAGARRAIDEAETLRADGVRLYQNAVSALGQGQIDEAEDYMTRAGARYDASLAVQDSEIIRNESRERSLALSAEILRIRQEIARREVEDLVARAQSEFFATNHRIAEELLIQAETLHAAAYSEEDPNIRYWLTIVRNTLSFRSGRTISFTAPLYPEMSQLLSSAEMEYAEGITLLGSRREEALAYFGNVRQKAQEVKLLFPLNQAASLLELRVDQVVDPAAFNASFEERLNTAVAGTKVADVQSFADLQDLALINPNYRGIAQIVYQAEIDMGLRPPPPNEVAIAHSRSLTIAAQNLIAGGVRSNLEIAEEQLTEALRVYPDNTTAQTELDRVYRLMGRRAASEIEAAADNDYEEALRELLAGNKLVAYSIVRRILSRPEYRNSSRFQELLQRIESVL